MPGSSGHFIRIEAVPASGTAVFKITLAVDGSFNFASAQLISDYLAENNLEGVQNGQAYSFYLVFEKGADGIWRIKFF